MAKVNLPVGPGAAEDYLITLNEALEMILTFRNRPQGLPESIVKNTWYPSGVTSAYENYMIQETALLGSVFTVTGFRSYGATYPNSYADVALRGQNTSVYFPTFKNEDDVDVAFDPLHSSPGDPVIIEQLIAANNNNNSFTQLSVLNRAFLCPPHGNC